MYLVGPQSASKPGRGNHPPGGSCLAGSVSDGYLSLLPAEVRFGLLCLYGFEGIHSGIPSTMMATGALNFKVQIYDHDDDGIDWVGDAMAMGGWEEKCFLFFYSLKEAD